MKKPFYTALFALIAGGTFSGSAVAQTQSYSRTDCELILESVGNTPITAEINGRRFQKTGTTLRFGNMPAGRKDITIYQVNGHRNDGGATARVIWEGRLITKRGVQTIGSVDASTGRVRFQNYRFDEMPYSGSGPGTNLPAERNNNTGTTDPGPQQNTPSNDGTANGISNAQNPSEVETRWNDLEKAVNGKITDTDKLKTLRDYIGNEHISVANLRRSMNWLSFEDTKLNWAKSKIGDVADPGNLSSLSSEFTFSSNQKAFEDAVAKARR